MKKNLTNLIYLCLLALTITACNKKEDDVKSLLTGKKWYYEKSEFTFNGETKTETPNACEADDYVIFNTNGTGTDGTGSQLCDDETAGEKTAGKWSLSSDNKTLTITEDNCSDEDCTQISTIEKITNSQMVLYFEESYIDGNGQTVKYPVRVYFKS